MLEVHDNVTDILYLLMLSLTETSLLQPQP